MYTKESRRPTTGNETGTEPLANNKNMLLAVLLNIFSPGFGQVCLGFHWIGVLLMFLVILLSYYGGLIIYMPLSVIFGEEAAGYASGIINLTLQAMLFMIATFDIIFRYNSYIRKEANEDKASGKSILKAVVLNILFPGVGLHYSGLKKSSIVSVMLFFILFNPINLLFVQVYNNVEWFEQWMFFAAITGVYLVFSLITSIIAGVHIIKTPKKEKSQTESKKSKSAMKRVSNDPIIQEAIEKTQNKKLNIYKSLLYLIFICLGGYLIVFNQSSVLNFEPKMYGIFIIIVLLKAYANNIDLIKGNWKNKKFDLSITTIFIILYTMGFTYASILVVCSVLVSLIVKKIYFKAQNIDWTEEFSNAGKNLTALTIVFLYTMALNPKQQYDFSAPQNVVVPIMLFVLILFILSLQFERVLLLSDILLSWLFYLTTVEVFSSIFYLSVVQASFTGILFIAFVFFVIQYLVEIQQEYLNGKIKMMEMEIKVFKDELTGSYNVRYLNNILDELKGSGERYSIIMLDIDDFKSINDNYGHQTGDVALKHLVNIAKGCTRKETDFICRYGGEEFAIILKGAPRDIAVELAERIRRALERTPFISASRQALSLTASFGVADSNEGDDIIKIADKKMYKAKHEGKNRVVGSETVA